MVVGTTVRAAIAAMEIACFTQIERLALRPLQPEPSIGQTGLLPRRVLPRKRVFAPCENMETLLWPTRRPFNPVWTISGERKAFSLTSRWAAPHSFLPIRSHRSAAGRI